MTDPTPIPTEALEAARRAVAFVLADSLHKLWGYCGSPCRCEFPEVTDAVNAAAPFLLAAGRTAAAADIRADIDARRHPMSADRLVAERAARVAENGAKRGFCDCESYTCRGECCGLGNCTCSTLTEGADQ